MIKEQVSDVSFRIKLPQTKIDSGLHDVFHSRNLIVNRPNADSVLPASHFDSNLNEELWEIEHIIAHDKHGKQNRFLIKWKGWPEVQSLDSVRLSTTRSCNKGWSDYWGGWFCLVSRR